MRYFKVLIGNYVDGIGTGNGFDEEGINITETEYNLIGSMMDNKPADTYTHYYVLRADTLEYEAVEREEPITPPEPTEQLYTLDEAATILAQEVSA